MTAPDNPQPPPPAAPAADPAADEIHFREFLERLPQLAWTTRADGYCDYLSPQWVAYTGVPERDHHGTAWMTAIHPDDLPRARAAWQARALDADRGYDVEYRVRRHDGQYRWFHARADSIRGPDGRILRWFGTTTDVHDHKRAELHLGLLARLGELLRADADDEDVLSRVAVLLGQTLPGVCRAAFVTIDDPPAGPAAASVTVHHDFCQPGVPSLTGTYPLASFGPVVDDLRRGDTVVIEDVLTHPTTATHADTYRALGYRGAVGVPLHRDGRWVAVLSVQTADPRDWQADEVDVIRIVAERTWLAVENIRLLREARDANAAKDRFIAVLSHELRTPLTPVILTVAALESAPDLSPELAHDLAMIRRNVELETKLIDDLLDVTRIANGKLRLAPKPVHAHELLDNVLEMCRPDAAAKRVGLAVECSAPADRMSADPARLQQIFWNLIKNAVKFTPEGGRVTIETDCPAPDRFRLVVRDTGIGIDPAALPRLFDAFEQGEQTVTREFGGLGLGLAISKVLVDLHNGRITADSPGRNHGATFTVDLPLGDAVERLVQRIPLTAAAAGGDAPAAPARKPGPGPHVLVVDDHPDTLKVMKRLMEGSGFRVTTANTVAAALDAAAQHRFDVVVSDLGLPDQTGHDLMRQIKARYGTPGIAVSGFGLDADHRESHAAGFDAHINKPISFDELRTTIAEVLARTAPTPAV